MVPDKARYETANLICRNFSSLHICVVTMRSDTFLGYQDYFINPLTPELNPSAQRCRMRVFTGDFAS
jgi:hypothetical protein